MAIDPASIRQQDGSADQLHLKWWNDLKSIERGGFPSVSQTLIQPFFLREAVSLSFGIINQNRRESKFLT